MLDIKHCAQCWGEPYRSAMSERTPSRLRYGVPAGADGRDSVDQLLLDWARERPDLDFTPVGVITRLERVRARMQAELATVFTRYGLTSADFTVIVTLRRGGEPYSTPQARLMNALGLTSGTVSVRLDRLERNGIVTREPDPSNARGSIVHLTAKGVELFDRVAPAHLANEERLLSALSPEERQLLGDLLRRLLADFETRTPQRIERLGVVVEPAHVARQRRAAVGLSDAVGLLVTDLTPDGPAHRAGLQRGDLITRIATTPVRSSMDLALEIDRPTGRRTVSLAVVRGDEPVTVRLTVPTRTEP
jgi:DNA-binding MarR family transcriptional regulator